MKEKVEDAFYTLTKALVGERMDTISVSSLSIRQIPPKWDHSNAPTFILKGTVKITKTF